MEPTFYTRRDFLRRLTIAGTAVMLPLASAHAANTAPAKFQLAGKVAAFKTGEFVSVSLPDGQHAYVRRLPGKKTTFLALNPACTHRGCPVSWEPAAQQFVCPCHGGRYNAEGVNISGPPPRPLQAFPTKVMHGTLYVEA